MYSRLHNKIALITGAARGLGLIIAEKLAAKGVTICGTDLRSDLLQQEMQRIGEQFGVDTMATGTDISEEIQVIALVKKVMESQGKIDILINNAGIRKVGLISEYDEKMWDEIHDSNLKGQFLCTREVLRQGMLQHNEGNIIFISSDAAKHGSRASSAYAASKWAGLGFAASVAKDLKESGIRTSTVVPGRMWTPMAEESEVAHLDIDWLDPRCVADAVLFCLIQKNDTVIPELQIFHRSQL